MGGKLPRNSSLVKCWLATSKPKLTGLVDWGVQKLSRTHCIWFFAFLFCQSEAWTRPGLPQRSQLQSATSFELRRTIALCKSRIPAHWDRLSGRHRWCWSLGLLHAPVAFCGSRFPIPAARSSTACPWCPSPSCCLSFGLFSGTSG